jgi:outer membrane lipoprotein-sorting protein
MKRYPFYNSTLRFLLAVPLLMLLAGCQSVRTVNKITVAPDLMDASLEQLIARMNAQYAAVQSFTARVEIASSTGGPRSGKVTDNPSLAGIIILRKPADLRVLMLKPVIGSRAIDMVSDGKNFRLFYSAISKTGAYEGPDAPPATPAKTGLESLRPNIIREALQVPAVLPDEFVSETQGSRLLPGKGKQGPIDEPDYDVAFLRASKDHVLETVRVVHISRTSLLPYQQDIYENGHVATTVLYDNYQKFGEVEFPMSISITRPIDEYSLKISVNKITLNEKIDDEQFVLKFPEGVVVQKMQ